jgi:thiol-disulfide isomerase/thioredoxin
MDEIGYLTFDYPYSSFSLFEEVAPLMIETGRIPELKKQIAEVRDGLSEALQVHLALPAPKDSTLDDYQKLIDSYERETGSMDQILSRLDLVGQKAPLINALHVFNADSSFSMNQNIGKVTILDFWTTWCIACVIGYAELGELYSDIDRNDIAVLGITSYQGVIYDLESGEQQGSEDEPVSQDMEREYIEGYIEQHRISWPCVISDRSAADPRYFIKGFPTYFILDREGIIRYTHFGVGKQKQIKRVIDQLLAEN